MDNVTSVGIDLAKNVFSVHGVNAQGREVLRRHERRARSRHRSLALYRSRVRSMRLLADPFTNVANDKNGSP